MDEQQIYQPDHTFDFTQLKLLSPTLINSAQFIKFKMNNSAFLLQSPKCFTKQGIVNSNKKISSDLVFTADDNEQFLKWIETLEVYCQQILYKNRNEWFDKEWVSNINEIEDIDNYFRNILKPFKGAKFYSMSVAITPDLKIYDENENDIDKDKIIGEQTNLLCILELEGIKCNLSNFQIQIKVRQMMTLQPIFSKCLIKKTNTLGNLPSPSVMAITPAPIKEMPMTPLLTEKLEEVVLNMDNNEFDEDVEDSINLKDRKQIFIEMYKNAKEKAKRARHLALMAYLEKNEIKNTYMLQDIESDDDDDELYE